MKTTLSEIKRSNNIFLGDLDSYTIIKNPLSFDELILLIKASLLLYDHILLPAAFFWQSGTVSHLLPNLEASISHGYILPMIRDYALTPSILDYYEIRREESKKQRHLNVFSRPELSGELVTTEHKGIATQLKDINSIGYIDSRSIRSTFIDNWRADINHNHDINSIRFLLLQANLSDEDIKQITDGLLREAENPNFSRGTCISTAASLIPGSRILDSVCNRISYLYLKSNADTYGSGFYISHAQYNSMVFKDNINLLMNTLSVFGITRNVLSSLSFHDIIQIKESLEYKSFITTYNDLLNGVYSEQNIIADTFKKKLVNEFRKEQFFKKSIDSLKIIQAISGQMFIGLLANNISSGQPDLLQPLFLVPGGIALGIEVIKRIKTINRYAQQTPFIDFKNYILRDEYAKGVYQRIGKNDR